MTGLIKGTAHPELHHLRKNLLEICNTIADFEPLTPRPPVIDSSIDFDATDLDGHWLQSEHIPGIKKLREAMKMDLEALDKFFRSPGSDNLPPLSTNAPYLISVWKEVLCAPPPVVAIMKVFQPDGGSSKRSSQRSTGVKVDVVAENGCRWIRINTNTRLLAEFREHDSYLTSSDEDEEEHSRPSLAQHKLDNTVIRMGRSLLDAANANLVEGYDVIPRVTLRLTRLDPTASTVNEPRIAQTIHVLQEMGVEVELGERDNVILPQPPPKAPTVFTPSPLMNLDLSILIALVSDLTHSPLPKDVDEAKSRFIPSQGYREWKQERIKVKRGNAGVDSDPASSDKPDPSRDIKHIRPLSNQLVQEMCKGLLQEMREQLMPSSSPLSTITSSPPKIEFWTTPEARDRCLRIISKIGGVKEKRRAHALFPSSNLTAADVSSLELAEELFWRHSRYPRSFIPLFPIRVFPSAIGCTSGGSITFPRYPLPFFKSLSQTCRYILSQETMPHPRALPEHLADLEIQRASVTKANPKLTAHTVGSLLWGAELGWTTLTANKAGIKAILREMKMAKATGRINVHTQGVDSTLGASSSPEADDTAAIWVVSSKDIAGDRESDLHKAALWVVDPRSLAEGMRSDYLSS